MYGVTLDFQCQHQQLQRKMPDRKISFAVNLPLKLFRATIANADIGSLSLYSLKNCLDHMLVKFEQNRMVQTTQNFELLNKIFFFYNHFWRTVDASLEEVSVAEIIVLC